MMSAEMRLRTLRAPLLLRFPLLTARRRLVFLVGDEHIFVFGIGGHVLFEARG
jgi:hypothetical protein